MPVVPVGGRSNKKISDVLDRARANLNDQAASLWTDNLLLPHVQSAYEWMYTRTAIYNPNTWRKVQGDPYDADIPYTAGATDITSTLPADLYLPEKLEWRPDTSSDWAPVDRVAALPTLEATEVDYPTSWCWINRRLVMNPAQTDCLLRLTYLSLFPDVVDASSEILIDNAVTALSHYTAAVAYASRGQNELAQAQMGSNEENKFPGALGMLDATITLLIMNLQYTPTRGAPFGGGSPWGWGWGLSGPVQ